MNINIDSGPSRDGGGGNDSPGGSSDDQRPWQSGPLVTNRPTNRWPLGTCETAIASSNLRSIILLCCQEARLGPVSNRTAHNCLLDLK